MTAAPLDLDALEAKAAAYYAAIRDLGPGEVSVRYLMAKQEYEAAILQAAPELKAAARERDKLREALEAAEVFIAEEIKNRMSQWPSFTEAVCDPAGALAKARAALGLSSAPCASAPSLRSPDPGR